MEKLYYKALPVRFDSTSILMTWPHLVKISNLEVDKTTSHLWHKTEAMLCSISLKILLSYSSLSLSMWLVLTIVH